MKKIIGAALIIITVFGITLLGALGLGTSARGETVAACQEYRVKPGDTLWNIAKEYTDGKKDIRKYIYNIMKENGMENPDLMPGQIIFIPIEH
jgi:LysM repeat protein